jgi:chorismate synthase
VPSWQNEILPYHGHVATLTYHTAGESHGPAMMALINGLPAGLVLDVAFINGELRRRQGGYGRGGRQRIEEDQVTFLAGVRAATAGAAPAAAAAATAAAGGMGRGASLRTMGSPLVMRIANADSRLDDAAKTPPVYRPRPGHADLAGSLKWLTSDCRDTLERASARETAARTAAGAVARCLLREFGIEAFGFVRGALDAVSEVEPQEGNWRELRRLRDASEVYCPDEAASRRLVEYIRRAKVDRDTVGGLAEVHVFGCPPGLGTCANWDERLDARLAAAVMGIQAFKAVEIGLGRECAFRRGSVVHDPIMYDKERRGEAGLGFSRPTNNAGGIEGGMTNGMPVVVRGTMKPISTLLRGMASVDLRTRTPQVSAYERSDVCALPAASVVMENVVAFEIARAFLEKVGGDTMQEVRAHYGTYLDLARQLPCAAAEDAAEPGEDQTES